MSHIIRQQRGFLSIWKGQSMLDCGIQVTQR